ncbi:alpha/beta hydrolase [Bacillus massiliglaciei]|uniref:alpha/beta hydrolase n=1 Tax=Bacillus massiliglaciei TaxID=1816693 RepID=UPI000A6955DC|nr:alpha/beta hydrolase [Bacillus massiliglaciei]
MKKWIVFTAVCLGYFFGIGIYFSNRIMFMKKKEDAFIQNREIEANRINLDDFHSLPKTEWLLLSPYGYTLKCLCVEPHQTEKWIIICHGITENKMNSIKYMNIFLKRGFNAVIYDHRRHGESGGRTSSYGYYEKFDLKAVVDEVKRLKGSEITIGVHGESMGAVTALLYAGMLGDAADFYIADCPFSRFEDQIKHQIKAELPLPSWMILPIGRRFIKWRDGYWTKDVAPLDCIQQIHHPVLFIHSAPDTYIPSWMTEALYNAKPGPKQLFLAKTGAHAQSYNEDPEEYEKQISLFLSSYVWKEEASSS